MYGPSHGPATNGKKCEACATKRLDDQKREREQRILRGDCMFNTSHGKATRGQVCDACYEQEQAAHTRLRRARQTKKKKRG